jgi:signal transduction histidine kinase
MDLAMEGDKAPVIPEFLSGGGEMGRRIREFDWSGTSLGPVEFWPQSLRTCIRIMLDSRQPIWIGWGKDLIKLYNDPYKAIVRGKHPWALGKPAALVWREIWTTIEPMLRQVMEMDEGTYVESQYLIMERNGYPEETYYTFSYTPIPGDNGGTAGMICFNTDDTERIISERQLSTLTRLGKNLTDSQSPAEVIHKTIDTLLDNPQDFPMACFYSITGDIAFLSDCTHHRTGTLDSSHHAPGPDSSHGAPGTALPAKIDLSGSDGIAPLVKQALIKKQPQILEDATEHLGRLPQGAWEVSPGRAMILPISQSGVREPYGFLLTGLNPYQLPDEKYRGFFSLLADQITTSFGNIYILDAERNRARALAEIDQAKTIFFSNISHEFRTPLTLLLGPIEDAINDPEDVPNNRLRMGVAYRNALRMQKLVNTLLEFSRIEAGRMDGQFTPVDIAAFTADLASSFRSAIEKAGMKLHLDLGPVTDEVYVDTVMWEKIILNLVSNAFKYTIRGSITVTIRQYSGVVRVSVSDTGIGIPDDQLERIFDRFHRVENISVRSQEGTGIGLSLVKELVRIHHGRIEVTSPPNEGSTFTIVLPTGKAHLPAERIGAAEEIRMTNERDVYVEESLQWLSDASANLPDLLSPPPADKTAAQRRFVVLLADDNADMRDYVGRLLSQHYHLITATNGEEAFAKMLSHRPDLLLTDIMMPRLDGFGLLRKIRNQPDLKGTPVIFLSARAGEESKVEGLEAGADDYLVKPFSARELIARVDSNLRINAARRVVEQELENEVKRRTSELNKLNATLKQSNEDLRQFAHVASHDLKEPVRKVKVYTGRLQEDSSTAFSAKARSHLEKINSAANRMLSMIEGVLHYSTINSTEQETEAVDLNRIIRAIETDLELPIGQKRATLNYSQLPTVEGAAVLLYQLFYNLINNSLKFSRADAPCRIDISAKVDGDQTLIRLTDNGIGFDQEQAGRIFDTFFRLNAKDKYEGTGLGLSLCKKIVLRHGGEIEAAGKKGEGSEFRIRLPLKGGIGHLI